MVWYSTMLSALELYLYGVLHQASCGVVPSSPVTPEYKPLEVSTSGCFSVCISHIDHQWSLVVCQEGNWGTATYKPMVWDSRWVAEAEFIAGYRILSPDSSENQISSRSGRQYWKLLEFPEATQHVNMERLWNLPLSFILLQSLRLLICTLT